METIGEKPQSKWFNIVIVSVLILGYVLTFVSGYYLSNLVKVEEASYPDNKKEIPVSTITPTEASTTKIADQTADDPNIRQDSTQFLPGKYYFDDTIVLMSKSKPYKVLVATITRNQKDTDYLQNTRVSYFNGDTWSRKGSNKIINDSAIVSSDLVKNWKTDVDSSRVLKESINGEITINGATLGFDTGLLTNEIVMRSLPGYTKFLSKGEGTLVVDGTSHPVYVLYTKIYSLNASEIQFYDTPFGLLTDWLVFWDDEGNMYHADATKVDKPTPNYQTHQIGIKETSQGAVSRTFQLDVVRDSKTPPAQYNVAFGAPIADSLEFTRINSINKAPNNSFTWHMGIVEGQVKKENGENIRGVGLIEYIKN